MRTSDQVSVNGELLAAAGRVCVLEAGRDGMVVAMVRGDTATYRVTRKAGGRFRCTCPGAEFRGICKHISAVALCTTGG